MKTRFSPSPTGQMHLGNVRTALFSWLLAKRQQGKFLLRIEDTDQVRSRDEFTTLLQHDLQWLSLSWDEGPFWQSQRQAIYQEYYAYLEQQQMAYPCFCSDEQLALSRKVQLSSGQPPRYAGTCRQLSTAQIAEKVSQGLKPTLRFKVPLDQEIHFTDLVKGTQRFRTDDIGDFIIRRGDGSASFFFCNAIDDAVMRVTHALRGEDHLTNTPRQLLILKALGLPIPHYGHIALILGDDGSPLSKRNGSRSLKELRDQGYLPIAINNYLGRLGHYYEQTHLMTLAELAENFSIDHLGKTPAHFDIQQLNHYQKLAVNQLDDQAFWQWIGEAVQTLVPQDKVALFIRAIKPNTIFPQDAAYWAKQLLHEFTIAEEAKSIFNTIDKAFIDAVIKSILSHDTDYQNIIQALQQQLGLKGKQLFQPLRVILTGQLHGPELAGIISLLGQEMIVKRLQQLL